MKFFGECLHLRDEVDNRLMPSPLLAIEHLRVHFPDVVAVNDLSLTVAAGDQN
jgi:ABC-type uncharacterized transport system ATPase subunit